VPEVSSSPALVVVVAFAVVPLAVAAARVSAPAGNARGNVEASTVVPVLAAKVLVEGGTADE